MSFEVPPIDIQMFADLGRKLNRGGAKWSSVG